MKYLKFYLILIACFSFFTGVNAQEQTACAQVLRSARAVYEDGRLHELPALLTTCIERGFSKEEKVEALRLLTLSYIYLGEPAEADKAMLNLLNADQEYKLNKIIEPTEFIALYNTFRTSPVYHIGFLMGGNGSAILLDKSYGVHPLNNATTRYEGGISFQAGITFEYPFNQNFSAVAEGIFSSKVYTKENQLLDYTELSVTETQNWIELPLMARYNIPLKDNLQLYGNLGGTIGMLLTSNAELLRPRDELRQVEGPRENLLELRNKINYGATGGGGIKLKLPMSYLMLDVRYNYSFAKLINPSGRDFSATNSRLYTKYGHVDDDFRINSIMVSVVYQRLIYKPKKLQP